MIRLWSKKARREETPGEDTQDLIRYAHRRLDSCRWGDSKPTCKRCPHHCYAPKQREQIRQVMRYAGPRMLWYFPMETLRHLIG